MSRLWGVLVSLVLIGCIGITPAAGADRNHDPKYNEDNYTAFYTPPDPLPPGQPGDLIRSEPSRLVLEPSGQLGAIMATGTRLAGAGSAPADRVRPRHARPR